MVASVDVSNARVIIVAVAAVSAGGDISIAAVVVVVVAIGANDTDYIGSSFRPGSCNKRIEIL